MQIEKESQIKQLSLTEINQAQSFLKFKRRWPSRLRGLLYLGIALVLFSGAGSAVTDRGQDNYWETSPTTSHKFQQDYSREQFFYSKSSLLFGSGLVLGLMFIASGLFSFRKYNACCQIETRLREQEIRLRSNEYPLPQRTGRATPIQNRPLTQLEREKQYPKPLPAD